MLIVTDRCGHRAGMYAITAAQFTAVGTTDTLVNDSIPKWGCPKSLLSDNAREISSGFLRAVFKLMGMRKLTTTDYHLMSNAGKECVNRTMAQILSMMMNEPQNEWGEQLRHVETAFNNSVNAATGLTPNKVH